MLGVSSGTTRGGNVPAKVITKKAGRDTQSHGPRVGLKARNPQFPTPAPNPHCLQIPKEPYGLTLHKNSWSHNKEEWARNIPKSFAEGRQQVALQAGQVGGKRAG